MIKIAFERVIERVTPDGSRIFFETASFPWVAALERE